MEKRLAVHGYLASRCEAVVEHKPDTRWSARCSNNHNVMVAVRGYRSIDEAIAALNESLAKHSLYVSAVEEPVER
jgi:hypothetical protein